MTKKVLFLSLFLSSSLFSLQIELVEDTSKQKDPSNNFFMKDNRKVYRAMEPNIIKALEPNIIKAMKVPIVLAFET